jgi:uncharacterized protein YutE (UPF0331/DUF86 family)/predicted nucleotidyltransferase
LASTVPAPHGIIRAMDDALIQRIRQAADSQFPGTGIILAYAFGSRVDGTARPDSDLDVGYYLAENHRGGGLSLFDEMVLADALSRRIGLEVDLRNLRGAPLDLRGRVLEEGVAGGHRVHLAQSIPRLQGNVRRDACDTPQLVRREEITAMVDKAKCDRILTNLSTYLQSLHELAAVPKDSFLANRDKIGHAKYLFVIAIEACVDAANHIISSERFRIPRDNADSFLVLIEEGVLPEEKSVAYAAMARFRNRLVHLYWDVEDNLVQEYLATRLDDFHTFLSAVAAFVARQPDS